MLSGGVHHLGDAGVRGVHGLDWVYTKKEPNNLTRVGVGLVFPVRS